MTPSKQLLLAFATTSIAIHWGTFALSDEGMYQPAGDLLLARRTAALPPDAFVALENGEHWAR